MRVVGAPISLFYGDGLYLGGLVVSNVALLCGAWFLYQLAEQQGGASMARWATLLLFLFPTGYVFSCLMSEGLFFGLTVGAWYFARRGNWLAAGVLGMLAAMTRLLGLLLAPLLGLEYLRQRGWTWRYWRWRALRPDVLCIGLVPMGTLIYMAVCWQQSGNPLAFVEAQDSWTSSRVNPVSAWLWAVGYFLEKQFSSAGSVGLIYGAIGAIVALGLLFWGRTRIGNALFWWSLGMLLISQSVHYYSSLSIPRFLAVIFPLYLILATIPTCNRNQPARYLTAVTLAAMQAATMAAWSLGLSIAI